MKCDVVADLNKLKDEKYKPFISKLMPDIDAECIIGVRTPAVRAYAKSMTADDAAEFMQQLPHKYYEENNVHSFLIERIKNYDECIKQLERFLPYVDNWATCDSMRPRVFAKHLDVFEARAKSWVISEHIFTARFGIEMFMNYYLDDNFKLEQAELISTVKADEYYLSMMVAWYFATALINHFDDILPFIALHKLDKATHNRTIRKAIESYRITDEHKRELKQYILK